jgi:hypothetical protein
MSTRCQRRRCPVPRSGTRVAQVAHVAACRAPTWVGKRGGRCVSILLGMLVWGCCLRVPNEVRADDCNDNGIEDICDLDCAALDGACQVPGCGMFSDCNGNLVPDICDLSGTGDPFADLGAWSFFDAGDAGVGRDPDGYHGAVFDGRYLYFVPLHNGTFYHAEVLRYDTSGGFADVAAWASFDFDRAGLGHDARGYMGGTYDGRYVYFAPCRNDSDYHGEAVRYDTTGPFEELSSWEVIDLPAAGVGAIAAGYSGAIFDGRFVYLVPYRAPIGNHGEVLQYDTWGAFTSAAAWRAYNPAEAGVGYNPVGYRGGTFDGRYVYFSPEVRGTSYHGEALRYDTTQPFATVGAWAAFDAGSAGIGTDPDGYSGAVVLGEYVYFSPYFNGAQRHGEVLRYHRTGGFEDPSSWATFDPGDAGVGTDPDGYFGAVVVGTQVFFAPFNSGFGSFGEVLRLETAEPFDEPSSWSTYDPGLEGLAPDLKGFREAEFDGRYVYFVPYYDGGHHHGTVLRFDTLRGSYDCNGNLVPDECEAPAAGDFNGDGSVDIADWAGLVACETGPDPVDSGGGVCEDFCLSVFDSDGDHDIDLTDVAPLLRSWQD